MIKTVPFCTCNAKYISIPFVVYTNSSGFIKQVLLCKFFMYFICYCLLSGNIFTFLLCKKAVQMWAGSFCKTTFKKSLPFSFSQPDDSFSVIFIQYQIRSCQNHLIPMPRIYNCIRNLRTRSPRRYMHQRRKYRYGMPGTFHSC